VTDITDWIKSLYEKDQLNTSEWYWITIMPTTTTYADLIPWNQRIVQNATWTDEHMCGVATRRTNLLAKIAIQHTLTRLDPHISSNHPERTRGKSRLAMILIPPLARRMSANRAGDSSKQIRVLHHHGWVVLNPPRTQDSTTPLNDPLCQVLIERHDIPTRVSLPEPVALLVENLKASFGYNINISQTPDNVDLVAKRVEYATRSTQQESTYPNEIMFQPGWYWKNRLRNPAVLAS
jgi:hypothetical protein